MASGVSIVTKANPRGRPLSRSIGRKMSETVPYWEKSSRMSESEAEKGRLPTYILVFIALLGSITHFQIKLMHTTAEIT